MHVNAGVADDMIMIRCMVLLTIAQAFLAGCTSSPSLPRRPCAHWPDWPPYQITCKPQLNYDPALPFGSRWLHTEKILFFTLDDGLRKVTVHHVPPELGRVLSSSETYTFIVFPEKEYEDFTTCAFVHSVRHNGRLIYKVKHECPYR